MDAATKLDNNVEELITNVARQRPEYPRVLSAGVLASARGQRTRMSEQFGMQACLSRRASGLSRQSQGFLPELGQRPGSPRPGSLANFFVRRFQLVEVRERLVRRARTLSPNTSTQALSRLRTGALVRPDAFRC
jgi:hypothetical protein